MPDSTPGRRLLVVFAALASLLAAIFGAASAVLVYTRYTDSDRRSSVIEYLAADAEARDCRDRLFADFFSATGELVTAQRDPAKVLVAIEHETRATTALSELDKKCPPPAKPKGINP